MVYPFRLPNGIPCGNTFLRVIAAFVTRICRELAGKELSRAHWAIEDSCHWVLDVVFRED